MWAQVELREKGQLSQIILGVYMSVFTYSIYFLLFIWVVDLCQLIICETRTTRFLMESPVFFQIAISPFQFHNLFCIAASPSWASATEIQRYTALSHSMVHGTANLLFMLQIWRLRAKLPSLKDALQLSLDPSFLYFFTAPLPSWHHPHQTDQTPSLRPFRADVVIFQIQVRQSGVLLQGLRQSLAGDTWLERHEWSTHHNDIPQTCKNLTIVLLIYKFKLHEGRLTLPGQLTAWLKKWPDYMQLLQGTFWGNPWTWFLMILNIYEHVRSY